MYESWPSESDKTCMLPGFDAPVATGCKMMTGTESALIVLALATSVVGAVQRHGSLDKSRAAVVTRNFW